jgi:putative salt-induced outer membrane protein YdiY
MQGSNPLGDSHFHEIMLSILLLQSTLLITPITGSTAETAPGDTQPLLNLLFVQDPTEDSSNWTGSAKLSLIAIAGNSESTNGAAFIDMDWAEGLDKVKLGARYAGNRTGDGAGNSTTTSRLYAFDAAYNRYFSDAENLFAYANAGTRQDEPNGLQLRAVSSAGVGYTFHVYEGCDLSLEGGLAYVNENKVGTVSDSSATSRAAFDFKGAIKWLTDVSLSADGEYLTGGDVESYVQNVNLAWNFTDDWDLSIGNSIAWDGNPSAGFSSTDRQWNLLIGTSF